MVSLKILDISGRLVISMTHEGLAERNHFVGNNLPPR